MIRDSSSRNKTRGPSNGVVGVAHHHETVSLPLVKGSAQKQRAVPHAASHDTHATDVVALLDFPTTFPVPCADLTEVRLSQTPGFTLGLEEAEDVVLANC